MKRLREIQLPVRMERPARNRAEEDDQIRTNFHTHTARCLHAAGEDGDYAQAAYEAGYARLGYSDHTPWPSSRSVQTRMRMPAAELEGYVRSVRRLQAEYKGRMEIALGLEAEYYPDMMGWLEERRAEHGISFLLFGNHYDHPREDFYFGTVHTPRELRRYADHALEALSCGAFDVFAHPDVFMSSYPRFDADCRSVSRELCAAARENGVVLEFNVSGLYNHFRRGPGFPCLEFWQLAAAEGAGAIIGIDAHSPQRFADVELYDLAVQHLQALGIPRVECPAGLGEKRKAQEVSHA